MVNNPRFRVRLLNGERRYTGYVLTGSSGDVRKVKDDGGYGGTVVLECDADAVVELLSPFVDRDGNVLYDGDEILWDYPSKKDTDEPIRMTVQQDKLGIWCAVADGLLQLLSSIGKQSAVVR